jgi:glycerol-3-phosphate dehydrogenase (NAD(P)+)
MKHRIAVIGDGGWGSALAMVLAHNGHSVTVWGPFADYVRNVAVTHRNPRYLPGVEIPSEIHWTADLANALTGADTAVLAVPTKFYSDVVNAMQACLPPACRVVSVSKGLDRHSHHVMTDVAAKALACGPVAALSGPSHAEEVARGIPTAVVAATPDTAFAEQVQAMFSNATFRVYTSSDVLGTQLGGALKNVIAVAVGISDGLGFGDNTRAALITRGLVEMTRLGVALGAERDTFAGLSGMGDLIVTCTSRLSRNRSVGERIGKGESVDQIMRNMQQAVEGIWNCRQAVELARMHAIDVPIAEQVYLIAHEGKNPRNAVEDLLAREVKPE